MEQFSGFPARMQFTPVPNLFFSRLLPQIDDLAELKTTLYLWQLLYQRRGYPRFVSYQELLAHKSLMSSLGQIKNPPDEVLCGALEMAARRGTILHLVLDRDGKDEAIYLLNTEADQRAADKIQSGEVTLPGLKAGQPAGVTEEPLEVYTLYEQNIGMLTPMIADELRAAEDSYPADWIREAIKEAAALNKRNWRYIAAILERWAAEGKDDGTYRRHPKTDPDKYVKGRYGHMVRR